MVRVRGSSRSADARNTTDATDSEAVTANTALDRDTIAAVTSEIATALPTSENGGQTTPEVCRNDQKSISTITRRRSSVTAVLAHDVEHPAVRTRDIDFTHLWRRLRADGWKAKRPTGLSNVWTYYTPDGESQFVGEDAVVAHVLTLEGFADEEDNDESDRHLGGVAQEGQHRSAACVSSPHLPDSQLNEDVPDDVRVSQIDTTVQLSQSTVDALFDARVDLSQAAVTRAFGLSQGDLDIVDDAQEELEYVEPISGSATSRDLIIKRDPNYLRDDEDSSAYEGFSSGGSDGDSDCMDDSDDDPRAEPALGTGEVVCDDDGALMDEAYIASLRIGDDLVTVGDIEKRKAALRNTQWSIPSSDFETATPPYPGMNPSIEARPVIGLRQLSHSPLQTFFYYMPKSLWIHICDETNRYNLQQVARRAEAIRARQKDVQSESLKQIKRRLRLKRAYETHEILHAIGLLIGRMLNPHQRSYSAHWAMVDDGPVSAGNFGRYMGRNRCQDILRDLQFVDNDVTHPRDKLWKLRPVIDKMQQRFLSGWTLPAVLSFDEGVLPATSKRNTTRMFMPDKPHRYGSKMFMSCDPRTAYCFRFEIYTGKRDQEESEKEAFDHKTGAAAVVRNLKIVLENNRHKFHTVVIDRFYTSVLLGVELLGMAVYMIGTIMTSRLGYDGNVREGRQTRPRAIPRGKFTFSRSISVPTMVAFH